MEHLHIDITLKTTRVLDTVDSKNWKFGLLDLEFDAFQLCGRLWTI